MYGGKKKEENIFLTTLVLWGSTLLFSGRVASTPVPHRGPGGLVVGVSESVGTSHLTVSLFGEDPSGVHEVSRNDLRHFHLSLVAPLSCHSLHLPVPHT